MTKRQEFIILRRRYVIANGKFLELLKYIGKYFSRKNDSTLQSLRFKALGTATVKDRCVVAYHEVVHLI